MSDRDRDCIVLGAGLIGLCLALRLAQDGREVTVVDSHGPLHGTTHTSGSLVTANEKRPLAYYELGRASMERMRSFAAEMDGESWFMDTGHLEWGNSPATRAGLDARVAELDQLAYPMQRLDPAEVMRDLEPDLVIPSEVESVVFFSDDSTIYPHLLAALLLRRLRALGVEMRFGGGPARLRSAEGGGPRVELGDGERLEARSIAVCAGRWTGSVLAGLGFELPMVSPWGPTPEALGFQVITTAVPVSVRRMIRMPGLSIRPAGGGRLMLHGRPEEGVLHQAGPVADLLWDRPLVPAPRQGAELVDKARAVLLNAEGLGLLSAVASIRALTEDGLPVAGWLPGYTDVYTVVTHSGIGLAPLLGELAAQEIQGGHAPRLDSFRPARFVSDESRRQPSLMREAQPAQAPTN